MRRTSQASKRIFLRYTPLSIPFPLIALTAGVGIASGYYIFNDLVTSAVDKALVEKNEHPTAVLPHLRKSTNSGTSRSDVAGTGTDVSRSDS
jgi:hypothetical protein